MKNWRVCKFQGAIFFVTTALRHRSSSGNDRVSRLIMCVAISTIFPCNHFNIKFGHTVLWVKINTPVCIWLFWALHLNHANSQICAQIMLFVQIIVDMLQCNSISIGILKNIAERYTLSLSRIHICQQNLDSISIFGFLLNRRKTWILLPVKQAFH